MSESTNSATVKEFVTVAAERAAFEAYYTQHDTSAAMSARVVARSSKGAYVLMQVHQAWLIWQARAALAGAPLAELRAQLEEERARNAAAQAAPQVVGYISRTGHGTYFRESLTPTVARLEFGGKPVWRPVAFVDAAPSLAIIPGADPK